MAFRVVPSQRKGARLLKSTSHWRQTVPRENVPLGKTAPTGQVQEREKVSAVSHQQSTLPAAGRMGALVLKGASEQLTTASIILSLWLL